MWGAVAAPRPRRSGPILGGLLTEAISWRWIFFVNLPVSVLAIALSLRVLPDDRRAGTPAGSTCPAWPPFTVAAAALTYGLIRANDDGWADPGTWGCSSLGAVALAAFVAIEHAQPSTPCSTSPCSRNGSFVGVLIAALLLNFARVRLLHLHLDLAAVGASGCPRSRPA